MNSNLVTNSPQHSADFSAQQKLADALSSMLDGHNVRYFKKEDGMWFVNKDVVEAAGGKWSARDFKEIVGDEVVITHPIVDSLGRAQDSSISHHRTIIKWATKSRLPKARELEKLVWGIIGDVADGKVINAQPKLTLLEQVQQTMHLLSLEVEKEREARVKAEALALEEKNKKLFQVSPALASVTARVGVEKRAKEKALAENVVLKATLNGARQGTKFGDLVKLYVSEGLLPRGSNVQDLLNAMPHSLFVGKPSSKGVFQPTDMAIEKGLLVPFHNEHNQAIQSRATDVGVKVLRKVLEKKRETELVFEAL